MLESNTPRHSARLEPQRRATQTNRSNARLAPLLGALALLGCADNLSFQDWRAQSQGDEASGNVVTDDNRDGTFTTHVVAEDALSWVYFDFAEKAEVPEAAADWDLGFQRFHIKLNGGTSGDGSTRVAVLADASFDALTQAPAADYLEDSADSPDDEDEDPDYAFEDGDGWYAYNPSSHTLNPRPLLYVVSTDSGYFKLEMLGYYDAAGTDASPSFRWAELEPPSEPSAQ
jgi:heme-binding HmuY-like protein